MSTLTLTVNGQTVNRAVQPATLLVNFLREELRLTGTHLGCGKCPGESFLTDVKGQGRTERAQNR